MPAKGTFELFLDELVLGLAPLARAFSSTPELEKFLRLFGYTLEAGRASSLVEALAAQAVAIRELELTMHSLSEDLETGACGLAEYLVLVDDISDVIEALKDLSGTLSQYLDRDVAGKIFNEIFDLLLVNALAARHRRTFNFAVLAGWIEQRRIMAGGDDTDARDTDYVRNEIHWTRIPLFFTDMDGLAEAVYAWGTDEFESRLLLERACRFFRSCQLAVTTADMPESIRNVFYPTSPVGAPPQMMLSQIHRSGEGDTAIEIGLALMPIEGMHADGGDTGLGFMPTVDGAVDLMIDLTDTLKLHLEGSGAMKGGVVFGLRPHSGLQIEDGLLDDSIALESEVGIELRRVAEPGTPRILLFGSRNATRVECAALLIAVGGGTKDYYLAAGLEGLHISLDVGEDGLLSFLIPEPIEIDGGDLLIGWRPDRGIYFEKGSGLEVRVPLDLPLGPVKIRMLGVRLTFEQGTKTTILASADLTLGPLFLSVDDLGLDLCFRPSDSGAFGSFDFGLGLQLPRGYGASLDLPVVSGGGKITVDDDSYKGALSLRFETFGFSAFAILTTRFPSGEKGYSFLASIFGEFEVQLGYGFKLTGLGGIIGIDRAADVEAVRNVLREGRLDGILFPANPIQDAMTILTDMSVMFPACRGQFLFGPVARIGWGTPVLVEGTLGIILEFGSQIRALILGRLASYLPTKPVPVVVLNVDFLGSIDFSTGAVGFDAALVTSRILDWPISGEMAIRTGWGASAGFDSSVGGFHPQFPQPVGFPRLQQVTISFGGNNPRITLRGYLALTANTAQMGATLDVYIKGPAIPFVGRVEVMGWAGFDALLQFNPFLFRADLSLGMSVKVDGHSICAVGGNLCLSGPNPYRVQGKVWAEVCKVKVKIPVDAKFGSARQDQVQIADGRQILLAAVRARDNWRAVPVSRLVDGAVFRRPAAGEENPVPVISPVGGLRFSQGALPLGLRLDKIGTSHLARNEHTFDVAVNGLDDTPLPHSSARGPFCLGQFLDIDGDELLRLPACESYKSGFEFGTDRSLQRPGSEEWGLSFEYENIPIGSEAEWPDSSDSTRLAIDVEMRRWANGGLRRESRPRSADCLDADLLTMRIEIEELAYAVPSQQATGDGVVVATVDGYRLRGSMGEVRMRSGDERLFAAYFLAR